jgi:hypothetical protein
MGDTHFVYPQFFKDLLLCYLWQFLGISIINRLLYIVYHALYIHIKILPILSSQDTTQRNKRLIAPYFMQRVNVW